MTVLEYPYFARAKTVHTLLKNSIMNCSLLNSFNKKYPLTGGFPSDSDGKESACHAEDPGSIPGSGRSPGERNGHPPQYSCMENSMHRGTWRATVYGVAKNQT